MAAGRSTRRFSRTRWTRLRFPGLGDGRKLHADRSGRPFRIDAAGEQAMAACGDLARDAVIAVPASGSSAVVGEARRRSAFVIAIASPGCAFALRHAGQSS
jgi:hypothetical protein